MMIFGTVFAGFLFAWFFFVNWFIAGAIFIVWFIWKEWLNKREREFHLRPDVIAERKEAEARDAAATSGYDKWREEHDHL